MWKLLAPGIGLGDLLTPVYIMFVGFFFFLYVCMLLYSNCLAHMGVICNLNKNKILKKVLFYLFIFVIIYTRHKVSRKKKQHLFSFDLNMVQLSEDINFYFSIMNFYFN